jgi:hypothetical protein
MRIANFGYLNSGYETFNGHIITAGPFISKMQ